MNEGNERNGADFSIIESSPDWVQGLLGPKQHGICWDPDRFGVVDDIRFGGALHGSERISGGQFLTQTDASQDCWRVVAYGSGMFTGIIQHIGRVCTISQTQSGVRLCIDPQGWDHRPNPGESIANNGCCLTLVDPIDQSDGKFVFDAIPETLSKTTIGSWAVGQLVNLERALRLGDTLDGHQVQGHVDGTAKVLKVDSSDGYRIRVGLDADLMRFMIPKGSITIDGVSLTIAALDADQRWVEVALIPETLARTILQNRQVNDLVNIEADVMVKTIVHTMDQMRQDWSKA